MKALSILMVLIGATFLSLSFLPARKIWKNVSGQLRRKWLVILNLMTFFLLGYLLFDVVLFFNLPLPLEMVTGGVFLGGAVFVFIIINLSQRTITAQQKAEEDIKSLNESLEQRVIERTRELKRLSDFNRTVLDCIADPISIIDVETYRIVDANQAFLKEINLPEGQIIGRTCFDVTHHRSSPCTPPHDSCPLMETVSNDDHAKTLHVYWTLLGEKRFVEVLTSPIRDEKGKIVQAIHIQRDITEAKLAEEKLRLLGRSVESSINGIIVGDATSSSRTLLYVNPAVERITGFPAHEMIGKAYRRILGCEPDLITFEKIKKTFADSSCTQLILTSYHRDGRPIWIQLSLSYVEDEEGTKTHYVAILDDITQRKHAEQEMSYQATHDLLTGLPNRGILQDRLSQAILDHDRRKKKLCIMFVDLDHFKNINDTIGHAAGDLLLKVVGERFRSSLRSSDTIARLGGDEFAVILPDLDHPEVAITLAEKIRKSLIAPFKINGRELFITSSIGLALYPDDGETPDELLKNADIAMYHAKDWGRNNYQLFSSELNRRVSERLVLETALRFALERDELLIHYQPRFNLATGQIAGMEALLRWQHPEMGVLSPDSFIPLAEEIGLIIPIGEWVLRSACAQYVAWRKLGLPPLQLAVNLSARQLSQPDLADMVAEAIRDTGIDPACLELELTETAVMQETGKSINVLNALKRMGLKLAIDDFGTGYSSLAYLTRLPIDILKVDKTFVHVVANNTDGRTLVVTIITMARCLGLIVVAEGVETEEQKKILLELRCEEAQGYLFSRPLPVESFKKLFVTLLQSTS